MFNISNISIAVMYILVISSCLGSPYQRVNKEVVNDKDDIAADIPQWLQSIFVSLGNLNLKDVASKNVVYNLHADEKQESTEDRSAMPIQFHKKNDVSDETLSHSSSSRVDKINPFIRTKRSTCQTPNLPQMLKDLNTRLNSSQYVGLNMQDPLHTVIPAGQPNTCPNTSTPTSWWPRSEVNLRSTCPWSIAEHDLGNNAYPRYISKAVCLCEKCIDSPSKRCEEVKQTVTYLYRLGCQDGLALIDKRNTTITVGCYCVSGSPQSEETSIDGPQLSD